MTENTPKKSKQTAKEILDSFINQAVPIGYGEGTSCPGIPHKGKTFPIPRNLDGSKYLLGLSIENFNMPIGNKLTSISQLLNNIVETLCFMIFELTPSQALNKESSEIHIEQELEKLLARIIEQLEQNRQNIKSEIQDIKNLEETRYDTFTASQDKMINLENESKEDLVTIKNSFTKIEHEIESLKKDNENTRNLVRSLEKSMNNIEENLKDLESGLKDKIDNQLDSLNKKIEDKLASIEKSIGKDLKSVKEDIIKLLQ
ncbi:hypothetical protein [Soymovirus malvae]|nr:hypothetical protein [Malva associated soymovirus 1]